MVSAFNVPITYMLFVDGSGYARGGVTGAFGADASLSLFASVALGVLLIWLTKRGRRPNAAVATSVDV
jgi:hypothetical protein